MKLNFFTSFFALSLILIATECRSGVTPPSTLIFAECGAGWILKSATAIDGVKAEKCEKLWCRDLENGKSMGAGDKANTGYSATTNTIVVESLDTEGQKKSIECFGERKWCAGETAGKWNPEYGAYTKKGEDSILFISVLRGDCFSWGATTSGEAGCKDGQTPVLVNGKWGCSIRKTGTTTSNIGKKSSAQGVFHRSATLKKITIKKIK
jgi:hypothetical protein